MRLSVLRLAVPALRRSHDRLRSLNSEGAQVDSARAPDPLEQSLEAQPRVVVPAEHDSDSRLGLSPCQRSSFRATMPDCVYSLSPKSPQSPGVRLKRAGAPVHTPAEDLANLARYCERISSRRFRARVEIDREGEACARHRGAY